MLFTPSTSPTAARPASQSTTIGYLSACGFCAARAETPSGELGRSSTEGCADNNVSPIESDADGGDDREAGRYERIDRSWCAVGGVFSTTSRLNFSGGAEGVVDGYGAERAALRRRSEVFEGGEEGL